MPSFPDSIFLFVLALLLFGPKRLPAIAREVGKWVGEFRRASNEFKRQMEDELRLSEQADRQKRIAAMEAAAPVTPPIPESAHPDLPAPSPDTAADTVPATVATETTAIEPIADSMPQSIFETVDNVQAPLPIATSGELRIMPPSTGLPTPQQSTSQRSSALKGLLDAIPSAPENTTEATPVPETIAHGN